MSGDEKEIRAMIQSVSDAFARRDAAAAVAHFSKDVVIFDIPPPLSSRGIPGNEKATKDYMDATQGPLVCEYSDIHIEVSPGSRIAGGYMFVRLASTLKNGTKVDWLARVTDIYEKRDGKWWVIHEHASVPVDVTTGRGVYQAPKTTNVGAEYSDLKKQ